MDCDGWSTDAEIDSDVDEDEGTALDYCPLPTTIQPGSNRQTVYFNAKVQVTSLQHLAIT